MNWTPAILKGLLIFTYFALFTVWVPAWLLELNAVASAPRAVSDLVGTASWLILLAIGIVALRIGQEKEWL